MESDQAAAPSAGPASPEQRAEAVGQRQQMRWQGRATLIQNGNEHRGGPESESTRPPVLVSAGSRATGTDAQAGGSAPPQGHAGCGTGFGG
jgi:hypothetical protein